MVGFLLKNILLGVLFGLVLEEWRLRMIVVVFIVLFYSVLRNCLFRSKYWIRFRRD